MTPELAPVKFEEREMFSPWQQRFAKEYNSSKQLRQGHILIEGIDPTIWQGLFDSNMCPLWIKLNGKMNIGFVSPLLMTVGNRLLNTEYTVKYVSDVYVDRRFRGKGILSWALKEMRKQDVRAISIDGLKLIENAEYYYNLGFNWSMPWPGQELLMLSTECHGPEWTLME